MRLLRPLTWAIPAAFLTVFFAYPVGTILARGLDGDAMADLLGRPSFWRILWFTAWQAAISTLLTFAVALPAAQLLGRFRFPGRSWLRALLVIPFVLPTVVVAGAFEALFTRFGLDEGRLDLRHTTWAVLAAHVFFNYAVVARTVGTFWAGLDGRVEDQARVLGASRWRTGLLVTLPRLWPAIAAAGAIVFLFSFTSFGVVLILGGPTKATLETEIYRYAFSRSDTATAAALAAIQLVAVVAMVAVTSRVQRQRALGQRPPTGNEPRARRRHLLGVLGSMTAILAAPLLVLIERSFASGGHYSLANYRALATRLPLLPAPATHALWNSLRYAAVATAIAVVIGALASAVVVYGRRLPSRLLDLGMMLPLGTSAVTVGLGIIVALDEPPLDLRTSSWIIPIAHALVGVPFVMRSLVPSLRSIEADLRAAASMLGATPAQVRRRIDLPLAAPALRVGAAFAFAISLGEFGATSLLPRRSSTLTAPLALFRLLGSPGDALRGQAMALAVVLMALTATAVLAIEHRATSGGDL